MQRIIVKAFRKRNETASTTIKRPPISPEDDTRSVQLCDDYDANSVHDLQFQAETNIGHSLCAATANRNIAPSEEFLISIKSRIAPHAVEKSAIIHNLLAQKVHRIYSALDTPHNT